MSEERNCLNCAFCEMARDVPTPTGFMCQKQNELWFSGGIPDKMVCEKHKFETGISIRDKIGEEAINGLWLMQKAKGWSRELFEAFMNADSAWLEK